jgi:4-amino-4-deoxy-L-arabinose transferase-like glycosyltransferase
MLRLGHLAFIQDSPVLNTLVLDSKYYQEWALKIAGGDIMGDKVFFMSPLYPYIMGLLYSLVGVKVLSVALLQILLSLITLWLIWLLSKEYIGERGGLIALWMGAVFPVWIYFDGILLTAITILFLNTLALYCLTRWWKNRHPLPLALGGMVLGLSALARPSILLFIGGLAVYFVIKRWHLAGGLLVLWALVAIAPVTVRNYLVSGDFTLTTASGGMNFFVGNNPQATGLYVEPEFLHSSDPDNEFTAYLQEAERLSWRKLTPNQASLFWYKMGLLYILENPLNGLKLLWNKFFYFWNNLEAPNNLSLYLLKDYSPIVRYIPIGFGMISALGLAGLFLVFPKGKADLLMLYLATLVMANIIFFTSSEFRFPALTVLLIGAGSVIVKLVEGWKAKRWNWKLTGVIIALLFFTHYQTELARQLRSPRMDYHNLGSVSLADAEYRKAAEFFIKSLRIDPTFSEGHLGLGTALYEMGEFEMSAQEFRLAGFPVTKEALKRKWESEQAQGNRK